MPRLTLRRATRGALAALWISVGCMAAPLPVVPASNLKPPEKHALPEPWISSSSGLFRCAGGTRVQTIDLLGLSDRVARRLEAMLGRPIPHPPGYPVYLVIHPARTNESAAAFARQHVVQPGGWAHRLEIWNLDDAPPAQVTLELVRLLLERYAVYQQAPDAREAHPAAPPAGLCSGIARVLFPALRDAALRSAHDAWLGGSGNDPVPLWSSDKTLDPPEDALAGAGVEWMLSRNPDALRNLIESTARGKAITPDVLAGILKGPDGHAARHDWHLWMALNGDRLTPWTQTPAERAAALRKALTIDHGVWPHLAPPAVPETFGPETLLEHRDEAWVRGAVPLMIHQLRSVPTGGLPELERAARSLDESLLRLRWPEAPAPWRWIPSPYRTRNIRRQIERANDLILAVESRSE